MSFIERVWFGNGAASRVTRTALRPVELAYSVLMSRRNARYDNSEVVNNSRRLPPAISIGNLTVGGTGKTPIAAWCVRRLRERGANPAVVMRGYGDDEWRVHTLLNPGTNVIVSPDRIAGAITARTRGADCVVLDDAFQHRRMPRVADVVLLSADSWTNEVRLLPAGPFREGLASLARASLVVITSKSAQFDAISKVEDAVRRASPRTRVAVVRIVPHELRLAASIAAGKSNDRTGLLVRNASWLDGRRVTAISAIGNPAAFESQLRSLGATLDTVHRFRDHHVCTAADADRAARAAQGTDGAVCTLKDAVKLASLWPREAPPLWYVSQSVVVDRGADALESALSSVLAARSTAINQPA
jgi:tetraacyldisaccharide 4'-kinase